MTLKDFKTWVNTLSDAELETELLYVSEEFSISGVVDKIEKATEDLYITHEDDPSRLHTKSELMEIEALEDEEELEMYDVEIPKDSYYINI